MNYSFILENGKKVVLERKIDSMSVRMQAKR